MDILICLVFSAFMALSLVCAYRLGIKDGRELAEDEKISEYYKNQTQKGGENGWENIISYTPDGHEK